MKKEFIYNGIKGTYRVEGEGYPLILIHGFGEDSTIWEPVISRLTRRVRVFTPDLPGIGGSQLPDQKLSIDLMADYIKWLLDAENIRKCIMVGHSMGGYITVSFAERYPDYLDGIGMYHSHPFEDSEEKKKSRMDAVEYIKINGGEIFVEGLIPGFFAPGFVEKQPEIVDQVIKSAKTIPEETLCNMLEAMALRPDRAKTLENITCPVLFVFGKEDKLVPIEEALQQSHLSNLGIIHIFERVGHMGMYESTNETVVIMHDFIDFVKAN